MVVEEYLADWLSPIDAKYFHSYEKHYLDDKFPWLGQQIQNYCPQFTDVQHPFPFSMAIVSFLSCYVLFFLSKIISPIVSSTYRNFTKDDDREKWNVKVVSGLHAAFVFQGALRSLLSPNIVSYDKHCGYATPTSHIYVAITFGYMFYDFIVSLQAYGLTLSGIFPSLALHHVNIIIIFFWNLKSGMGYFFSLAFMLNEISQPFLHFSWILIKMKVKPMHPVSIVNSLCLVLTFIGSRFFYNLYIYYLFIHEIRTFDPRDSDGLGFWTASVHVGVNIYWCRQMVVQIMDMLSKKKKPEPGVDLNKKAQ
jgi:hypothetical protein